jgi:hypothetical protein
MSFSNEGPLFLQRGMTAALVRWHAIRTWVGSAVRQIPIVLAGFNYDSSSQDNALTIS